jgi:energy-coupling factor transporter ATP-binding protein EcfA2
MTPAIRIERAHKRYGGATGFVAVSDVALTVNRGAIHGLLGPNGAGKTTTLKMLLGLVRPSGGTFEILGEPAGAGGPGARRFPARAAVLLAAAHRSRGPDVARAALGHGTLRGRVTDGRASRSGRARGQGEDAAGEVLAGNAPACRDRPGPHRGTRGGRLGRARVGARPGGPAGRAQPHDGACRGGHDRAALIAPALRGRSHL